MNDETKFWINDPSVLFLNASLIPTSVMNLNERYNALTRLVIVVHGILMINKVVWWWKSLIASLVAVILIRGFIARKTDEPLIQHYEVIDANPIQSSENKIPPPEYIPLDELQNIELLEPDQEKISSFFPYLNRPTATPSTVPNFLYKSSRDSKRYMRNIYTESDLQFRNDITRPLYNKLNRIWGHGSDRSPNPEYEILT